MKRAILLAAAAALLQAQDLNQVLRRGEEAFVQTCGSGYCHGGRGVGGGAPRLAARGFAQAYINTTVRNGVPGTGMPSFAQSLPAADLTAIVAYVSRLNGIANPAIGGRGGAPAAAPPKLSAEAARGRDLFTDPVRGFGRCSTCHLEGGFGIAVAAPVFTVPANAAALKALATPRVVTATVAGDSMPALPVAVKSDSAVFYDLTTAPPVRRTVAPAALQTREETSWRHASVIGEYSDTELTAILAYLRAVAVR
jgi:mono/diheme cytochrome c family protein